MLKKILLIAMVVVINCMSIVAAGERDSQFAMSIGRTDIKGDIYHHQGTVFKMSGGQRVSDYLSFDAGIIYYAEVKDTAGLNEMKIKGHAWNINILAIAPLTAMFEAFGKLGVSKWHFRGKEEVAGVGAFQGKADGEDPTPATSS